MKKHYRIVRRYSAYCGTWYVIQKKIMFWWFTLPFHFSDAVIAKEALDEPFNHFIETPIIGFPEKYFAQQGESSVKLINWFLRFNLKKKGKKSC